MCPSCGEVVPGGRRFCRCGAQLALTAAVSADSSAAVAEGWTRPAFRRVQRAANGGRRVRYDAPLAARVHVVRGAVAGVLVLALASQAPPWGPDVRNWVGTRVEQSVPWQ
jgi:hypothetical protein